jgi:pimeloyl-ACP methyl ester carboxylesterase
LAERFKPVEASVAQGQTKATVILVHAAWSDGSSWGKVISSLDAFGIKSVAAQLLLKSLREDAHIVRQLMDRQGGPVVLVGHSYGGAVISLAGAGRPEVASLAYIAAIVPDQGETVGAVFTRAAPHAEAPQLAPDPHGLLWVDQRAFDTAVAPDASDGERRLLAAVQKPISGACLGEALDQVAWRSKPVHFLIAERDRMVAPATQRFLAGRMKARTVSLACDHTPLLSEPASVARFIADSMPM